MKPLISNCRRKQELVLLTCKCLPSQTEYATVILLGKLYCRPSAERGCQCATSLLETHVCMSYVSMDDNFQVSWTAMSGPRHHTAHISLADNLQNRLLTKAILFVFYDLRLVELQILAHVHRPRTQHKRELLFRSSTLAIRDKHRIQSHHFTISCESPNLWLVSSPST